MKKGKDRGAVLPAPTITDPRRERPRASSSPNTHLRTHTSYPKVHVVAVGDMTEGYQFYGPFSCAETAMKWAVANLKVGESVEIYPMSHVRGMYGGLMSH